MSLRQTERMPFGKHKGVLVCNLPNDYLWWLYEQADIRSGALEAAIEDEVFFRRDPPDPQERVRYLGISDMDPFLLSVCRKIMEAGYRNLALKNHPDQGGDVRAMQAINSAIETLRGIFGKDSK